MKRNRFHIWIWTSVALWVSFSALAQPAAMRAAPTRELSTATLMLARPARPIFPSLETADAKARSAQQAYEAYLSQVSGAVARRLGHRGDEAAIVAELRAYYPGIGQRYRNYVKAELALARQSDDAWKSIQRDRRLPLLINEPLQLAMLGMQVELRRNIGPLAHTRVDGLVNDRGCAGDLVADRLIYRYGQAVSSLAGSSDGQSAALGRIAKQIACLSSRQLTVLELALANSHRAVASRLAFRGWPDLAPVLTRHVAPLQLLVLDARKHRGEDSASWLWFVSNRQVLADEVSRLGWPGDTVWLWDRLAGRMVGYPRCLDAARRGDCVDSVTFLESLLDPKALGRGDCALSAMVSRGPVPVPGGRPLYVCPSLPCATGAPTGASGARTPGATSALDTPSSLAASAALTPSERFNLPWKGLTEGDVATMRALCGAIDSGSRMQGDEVGDCFFANQAKDPFDHYLQCVSKGLTEDASVIGTFAGVPMSRECRLSQDEGAAGTASASGASGASATPATKKEEEKSFTEKVSEIAHAAATTVVKLAAGIAHGVAAAIGVESVFAAEAGTGVAAELSVPMELLSPTAAGAQGDVAVGVIDQRMLYDAEANGTITLDELNSLRGKTPAEVKKFLEDARTRQGATRACSDPLNCSDSCTGLGQSLATARACSSDLLTDLLSASGRPTREPVKRPGWVSLWHPDQAPASGNDYCLPNDSPRPEPGTLSCGLVLCPGGGAIASASGQCCGSGFGAMSATLSRTSCLALNCPNGGVAVDSSGNCSCPSAEPAPRDPPSGPQPRPDRR